MGVGSIFILVIVILVAIGGAFAFFGLRAAAGHETAESTTAVQPSTAAVTTPYHERVDMPASARERDRTATQPEHQTE